MEQYASCITLGVTDQVRARRFYTDGFGWTPVAALDDVTFYQLGGLVLALFDRAKLGHDMARPAAPAGVHAGVALAHNVRTRDAVAPCLARLADHGGTVLKPARTAFWGGEQGYVADPDGHVWEVAWNPAWPIDAEGRVTARF